MKQLLMKIFITLAVLMALLGFTLLFLASGVCAENELSITKSPLADNGSTITVEEMQKIMSMREELSKAKFNELKTDWVGVVSVGIYDKYFSNITLLPEVELGLREDGVLVWRYKEDKK